MAIADVLLQGLETEPPRILQDRQRAVKKAQNFEALWQNQTENAEVMDFPKPGVAA